MFVLKAAVVGAGTTGGEIAPTIANADVPVVLKFGSEDAREGISSFLSRRKPEFRGR
jgi:3-hydroxyacyl-CoA dehydrogenase